MSEIQPRDILLYAGGDAWRRFGTFVRRTTRIARGGEGQAEQFTRPDGATPVAEYLGGDGLYHLAAQNIIRPHYVDLDGDGIAETLTFLAEDNATNSLLQSAAWATSPWASAATNVAATNGAATAPDGTLSATHLVENTAVGAGHRISQLVAVTSGENLAVKCTIQAAGRTRGRLGISDSGFANKFYGHFDLVAGTIVATTSGLTCTGAALLPLGGGYFRLRVWGIGPAATTANFDFLFEDNAGNPAYTGDGVSGFYAWGAQLERNGTTIAKPPTAYIPTGAATASRSFDTCDVPVNLDPAQDMTIYAEVARPLSADQAGTLGYFPGIVGIGTSGGYPQVGIGFNSSTRTVNAAIKHDAGEQRTASRPVPSGSLLRICAQYASLATGGTVAVDVGSGFSAPSSPAATAFSAYASNLVRIGQWDGSRLGAGVKRLLVVKGLHTSPECQAVA